METITGFCGRSSQLFSTDTGSFHFIFYIFYWHFLHLLSCLSEWQWSGRSWYTSIGRCSMLSWRIQVTSCFLKCILSTWTVNLEVYFICLPFYVKLKGGKKPTSVLFKLQTLHEHQDGNWISYTITYVCLLWRISVYQTSFFFIYCFLYLFLSWCIRHFFYPVALFLAPVVLELRIYSESAYHTRIYVNIITLVTLHEMQSCYVNITHTDKIDHYLLL